MRYWGPSHEGSLSFAQHSVLWEGQYHQYLCFCLYTKLRTWARGRGSRYQLNAVSYYSFCSLGSMCRWVLGEKCSINEKKLLTHMCPRLFWVDRMVCGCPWSLFGCQGNFFLWIFTRARNRWLTVFWLWPCAWTADVPALVRPHPKRPLCQLYLVPWFTGHFWS